MSRAKEWEEELIDRFPNIDRAGLTATAEFIAILEEMGGFDKGAYLKYFLLTHDIYINGLNFQIAPVYFGNQVSRFRCVFISSSTMYILPTPEAIQVFLTIYWDTLFPKENT